MEKYAADENVPMKFHKFLVYFIIPLSLLVTLIAFIVAIGTILLVPVMAIVTLVMLAASFVLYLAAEILLVQMRRTGVILLYVGYIVGAISSLITLFTDFSANNLVSLVFTVGIGILVYFYYEKRTALFH